MAKIFTRRIIALLVILILLEIILCVSIEDKALASDSLLTSTEKYLIKKYGWGEGDYVERWPDGIIYVYNGTPFKGLPKIIKKINQIIGNKTIFQLSNDKEISKVVFKSYASNKYAAESDWSWDGHSLKKWVISIDNKYTRRDKLFLAEFTKVAGFNFLADEKKYGEWWEFTIDRNVEKMLKALYKVPPGHNLSTRKVDEVSKLLEKINTQNTGVIKLISNPSGASVFLDDSFKGVSSITLENITPGKHMLKVTKTGYQDWQQEVTVSPNKTIDVTVNLVTIIGAKTIDKQDNIFLSSTPSAAKIYLDNKYQGITPQTLSNLNPGTYQLRLTKSGYQDWQQEVTVSFDKTVEIFVYLAPLSSALGEIKLTSTPSSAKVFLDAGQYMGKTPLTIDKVSPGKHKVTLVLADYEKYVQEVDVIAGKVIDVSATLVTTRIQPMHYPWKSIIVRRSMPPQGLALQGKVLKVIVDLGRELSPSELEAMAKVVKLIDENRREYPCFGRSSSEGVRIEHYSKDGEVICLFEADLAYGFKFEVGLEPSNYFLLWPDYPPFAVGNPFDTPFCGTK